MQNIEANAILYFVLQEAQQLTRALDDTSSVAQWSRTAEGIKSAANKLLWNDEAGLYRDNQTTTMYPQDGNSWAVKANLTLSDDQRLTISKALRSRWGRYGAPAPEAGATVSPFIGGFELQAHYMAD
jgi:neutral trehalase